MMLFKRLSIVTLLFSALIAVGCAPSSKFIRTSSSFEPSISNMKSIAIINDVALTRDNLSDKYISTELSLSAASYMLEGAKTVLTEKGYNVDYELTPFVGGFLAERDSLTEEKISSSPELQEKLQTLEKKQNEARPSCSRERGSR
jgi:hypothetical protein